MTAKDDRKNAEGYNDPTAYKQNRLNSWVSPCRFSSRLPPNLSSSFILQYNSSLDMEIRQFAK